MTINDFIPAEYIPAIITASVALIAAVIAQIINNYYSRKRENKKYLEEVYGNFISKFFNDIIAYAYANSRPMLEEESVNISLILEEMFEKVHYGNPSLQSLHFEYSTWRFMEDNNEDTEKLLHIKTCYHFLLYSQYIFHKLKFSLEPNVKFTLEYTIKVYGFLFICTDVKGFKEARNDLTSIRRFYLDTLSKIPSKKIHKLVTNENIDARAAFIKTIEKEIQNHIEA